MDPARRWTEREIAARIAMSPNTVNQALRSLRDEGVLSFRRVGPSHSYRLQDTLVVVQALQDLFHAERSTTDTLLGRMQAALPPGVACILFGSTARGTATPGSDVDVLVVASTQEEADTAAGKVQAAAATVLPIELEILALDAEGLQKRRDSPLMRRIEAEGQDLGTAPLGAFL